MAYPVRILILDPDDHSASACMKAFAGRGWNATHFPSFQEAEASLALGTYEIAMIDLILPDMDGTEAWSRVRAMNPDTLGIITTSSASLHSSIFASEKGVLAYLQKPLRLPAVSSLISESLSYQNAGIETGSARRQMAGLCQLLSSIGHSNDRTRILKNALAHLPAVLNFDIAAVYILDEKNLSWLRFVQQRPFPRQVEFADEQSEFVQNLVLEVIHSLQPQALLRSNTSDRSGKRLRLQELGFSDLLLAPIMSTDEPSGALAIISGLDSDISFSSYEVDLLTIVSQALGLALERGRESDLPVDGHIHDEATGAFSMAYLDSLIGMEAARLKRHGQPFSLLLIDSPVPGRRSADEREGRRASVQGEVVNIAQSMMRRSDIVASLPEWQVAILMPETTQAGAQTALDRVRGAVESGLAKKTDGPLSPFKATVLGATAEVHNLTDMLGLAQA